MKTRVVVATVLMWMASGMAGDLLACGTKFLVPGRGIRFQRTASERQASTLLIYAPPASALSATLAKLRIEPLMRKAGYQPVVLTRREELDQAAMGKSWDIVVTDIADGAALKQQLVPEPLHLIAVAQKSTNIQLALARAEFPLLMRSPSRAQDFLDAIDSAGVCAREDRAAGGKSPRP